MIESAFSIESCRTMRCDGQRVGKMPDQSNPLHEAACISMYAPGDLLAIFPSLSFNLFVIVILRPD